MGARLEVGRWARLTAAKLDTAAFEAEIERANAGLVAAGLAPLREPGDLAPDATLVLPLWDATALHYLRRLAAHLWTGSRLPAPGTPDSLFDFAVEEYYRSFEDDDLAAFWERARADRADPDYEHLMLHADDGGLWVPQAFPNPVQLADGELVGSAAELGHECRALAAALELDPERWPDEAAVLSAARSAAPPDSERDSGGRWQRYGIESHTCLTILRACDAALSTGAALVLVSESG